MKKKLTTVGSIASNRPAGRLPRLHVNAGVLTSQADPCVAQSHDHNWPGQRSRLMDGGAREATVTVFTPHFSWTVTTTALTPFHSCYKGKKTIFCILLPQIWSCCDKIEGQHWHIMSTLKGCWRMTRFENPVINSHALWGSVQGQSARKHAMLWARSA